MTAPSQRRHQLAVGTLTQRVDLDLPPRVALRPVHLTGMDGAVGEQTEGIEKLFAQLFAQPPAAQLSNSALSGRWKSARKSPR